MHSDDMRLSIITSKVRMFMSKTIYIANLPVAIGEDQVRELFSVYGTVHSIKLIQDAAAGTRGGYGFVEMDEEPADLAIEHLSGKEFHGQPLQVNQARGRSSR